MNYCLAPFCQNKKYSNKNKTYGYCRDHINERLHYSVKSYKPILPLWAFFNCKTHGFLNYDQVYIHFIKNNIKRIKCKKCTKSYIKKNYDPVKQKSINDKNSLRNRNTKLKKAFGVGGESYNKMLEDQNYSCFICSISIEDYIQKHIKKKSARKHFDIDHCHITGKVRGLLCHSCNVGIGFLQSNPQFMERAASYLRY